MELVFQFNVRLESFNEMMAAKRTLSSPLQVCINMANNFRRVFRPYLD